MATQDNLGPQFKVIQGSVEGSVARTSSPRPRAIRISDKVRESYAESKPTRSAQQSRDTALRNGLLTTDEHAVLSNDMKDHPLHPDHGSVVKGSVIHNELES